MGKVAKMRVILEDRKSEIEARLREIETELDSHMSKDWEELATERESDEVLEREGTLGQEEIAKIQAAFVRMDQGEFGYCVKCGDEVSEERLAVVPHTPFCRKCVRNSLNPFLRIFPKLHPCNLPPVYRIGAVGKP